LVSCRTVSFKISANRLEYAIIRLDVNRRDKGYSADQKILATPGYLFRKEGLVEHRRPFASFVASRCVHATIGAEGSFASRMFGKPNSGAIFIFLNARLTVQMAERHITLT
jgi:hypothetical protein